jgi:hypothetical protein
VLQAETLSLSGGVHHWLKRRSTREERKPVTRNDDDDDNNNNNNAVIILMSQCSCFAAENNMGRLIEATYNLNHAFH